MIRRKEIYGSQKRKENKDIKVKSTGEFTEAMNQPKDKEYVSACVMYTYNH